MQILTILPLVGGLFISSFTLNGSSNNNRFYLADQKYHPTHEKGIANTCCSKIHVKYCSRAVYYASVTT
jgi:hypothetical protein